MADLFISDWDGTLINNEDDMPILKKIAMDEFKRTIGNPRLWKRTNGLLEAKKHLEEMYAIYKENPEEILPKMYFLYGSEVLSGIPMERVINSARKYGSRAVRHLDGAFEELWDAAGERSQIIILTAALEEGVRQVLTSEWLRSQGKRRPRPYVYIDGSIILEENWIAKGIELRNYDGKAERIRELTEKAREKPNRIIYMGNDFRDEDCAGIADVFVLAPLATDDFKQHMASKYGNRVRMPSSRPGEVYKAFTID